MSYCLGTILEVFFIYFQLEVPDFEVYTPVKGSPISDSPVEEFELVSMSSVSKDEVRGVLGADFGRWMNGRRTDRVGVRGSGRGLWVFVPRTLVIHGLAAPHPQLASEPRVALDDTAPLEPTAPEEFDDFEWVEALETPPEEEDLVVYEAATQGGPLTQGSTSSGSRATAVPLPTVLNGGPVIARPPTERTPTARSARVPLQDLNSARLPVALRKPSSFKLVKANAAYAVCRFAQYAERAVSARGRRNPRLNADALYFSMLR